MSLVMRITLALMTLTSTSCRTVNSAGSAAKVKEMPTPNTWKYRCAQKSGKQEIERLYFNIKPKLAVYHESPDGGQVTMYPSLKDDNGDRWRFEWVSSFSDHGWDRSYKMKMPKKLAEGKDHKGTIDLEISFQPEANKSPKKFEMECTSNWKDSFDTESEDARMNEENSDFRGNKDFKLRCVFQSGDDFYGSNLVFLDIPSAGTSNKPARILFKDFDGGTGVTPLKTPIERNGKRIYKFTADRENFERADYVIEVGNDIVQGKAGSVKFSMKEGSAKQLTATLACASNPNR